MNTYGRRKKPESAAITLSPPQLLKKSASNFNLTSDYPETRLSSLKQALNLVYKKIIEDPMLKVLSSDNTSSEFVNARVNEIFHETIENERESYYSSLLEKYFNENLNLRDEFLQVFFVLFIHLLE